MMSATAKFKTVGCTDHSVISSGVFLEQDISFFNSPEYAVFPGFCDVHVHFREPGFSYKETMETGSKASARGGYTDVCTMPNLNPVPDSKAHLAQQLELIKNNAVIHVYPYGAITVGEQGEALADLEGMAPDVIAFSDDGKGVQNEEMMRQAMLKAKKLGKMIVAHCEVNDLLHGGYIHDGEYAKLHGHKGICSASEYEQIARDIRLAEETGCPYHVCHISTKESVRIIREAKARGVDVTCETAPHYLIMNDMQLQEEGRFRMNPPIRSEEDRLELVRGIQDGTIDMIATDHAPHSAEEKSGGLAGSAFGVVGIETAFAAMYTHMVLPGIITLERLIEMLTVNPRNRFGIPQGNSYTVWDLSKEITVEPAEFLSMGKATPFEGLKMMGQCVMTVCDGKVVYRK